MKENSVNKIINGFVFITGILLLLYTAYRSATLSFTHDESYTFTRYINFSVSEIISYKVSPVIANNHILNTLCMKWQSAIFGNSEFSLRLHSWIAHIFYVIFSYLILQKFKSNILVVCGFILLNFNPYLLDFFSLARGYALSITLMLISIYYFTQYHTYSKNKHAYLSLLISLLAVLANFVLISYSLSLILVFGLLFLQRKTSIKDLIKKYIPVILTLFGLVLIYKGPIKILTDNNQLNFESDSTNGFDTVISSVVCYLYSSPYFELLLMYFRVLVAFTVISFLCILFLQFKSKSITTISYISFFLLVVLAFNFAQHLIFGSSYFRERFALFLVPLFFITFLNVILFLKTKHKLLTYFGHLLIILTTACAITVSYTSMNLAYVSTWVYDCDTKTMLEELCQKQNENHKLKLGITWLFEPTINFYRETKQYKWIEPVNREGLNSDYDFYYVELNDIDSFDTTNKVLVKNYTKSGSVLYKTKNNN